MRHTTAATLVLATLLLCAPNQAQSQIGGLIKKKAAEAVKGDKKDKAKSEPTDTPITSQLGECGPLTPEKVSDFLRGLTAEKVQRSEYDAMLRGLRTQAEVVACRNREIMSPEFQTIMGKGITEGASNAQLMKAMENNRLEVERMLTKKCGEDPSKYDQRKGYEAAHKAGANAAGLTEKCYDALKEHVLAFCNLSPAQQQTAMEKGIKAPGQGSGFWIFTADEAKAMSPRCGELVPAINATGFKVP